MRGRIQRSNGARRLAGGFVLAASAFLVALASHTVLLEDAQAAPPGSTPSLPPPESTEPPAGGARDETSEDDPKAPPAKPKLVAIQRVQVPEREGMLLLPGGRFPMGTGYPKAPSNERPQRVVAAAPFWIDKTEVTVGAYRACVEANHCARPRKSSAVCTYDAGDTELPVSCVRWQDADTYCRHVKKRLPTEIEWEHAARGPAGYVYPWGNRLPDCKLANTLVRDNSGRSCATRPWRVGSAPGNASIFGVVDMAGNVEEWTADWYAEHLSTVAPRSGASHTLRGGGFQTTPLRSRTSTRDWGSAIEAGPNVGFRCARDAAPIPVVVPARVVPLKAPAKPMPSAPATEP